jgi:hypothetical protein
MISKIFTHVSVKAGLIAGCASLALVTSPMVSDTAFAQQSSGNQMKGGNSAGGGHGAGAGQHGGGISGKGKGLSGIFRDVTGMDSDAAADEGDEDSDKPEWAGQSGGKDGAGGGQPATSGSKKGDLFGDLWVILRDENGVPILADGFVQPVDADGTLIPLDEEGMPIDATLVQEVELGRLNVGRAPTSVLDRRADEVITLLNTATAISLDASGRLVLTVDGVEKTIDSPLENLAIYVALLTDGTIPGVDDLPGDEYDFMVDGQYTTEDLELSVGLLAAATDKTGAFTPDEIAYIDAFLGINTTTDGNVTYSVIDYADFTYDREATYGEVTASILVEQDDGSFVATDINVFDFIFEGVPAVDAGTLDAYTLAADDARTVLAVIHEFDVPEL